MKKLIALLLALVMVLSLTACGGSAPAEDKPAEAPAAEAPAAEAPAKEAPIEIEVWHYFDSSSDKDLIVQWIEEYNNIQDKVHVTGTYVSRPELMNQYIIGAVSGELPDIGMVDSPDMASYISLGVFEDITEQLNAWGELDYFYPGPLSSCMDPEGNLYGLPQNSNCLCLAVNMDLLAAAGYNEAPDSLDELLEIAKATTDPANSVYGMAMCCIGTEEGTFQMLPWLRSVVDGVGVNVDNLTAPSAVAGLSALAELINSGSMSKECVNWTQADAWTQFCTGKAAMVECGTWHLAMTDEMTEEFNYQIVLLPTGAEGTSTSTIGGENFGVCSGAVDVDACVDFLIWMCSKENEKAWAENAGKIPTRSDSEAVYTYEVEGFATFVDQMNYAQARGPHAEWPTISEAIYTATQSVFLNGVAPADALATAMETIAPIVAENPLP